MRNRDFYLYDDDHSRVTLSREGLRRAANDNAMLVKSSRLYEIAAYCAVMAGVVLFVAWLVDLAARSLA